MNFTGVDGVDLSGADLFGALMKTLRLAPETMWMGNQVLVKEELGIGGKSYRRVTVVRAHAGVEIELMGLQVETRL